jgi:hypothetical protein
MYCQEYNCLFVHIPKTAGKSIESFFLSLLGLGWDQRSSLLLKYNSDPSKGPERLAHLTAQEYVELQYLTRPQLESAFSFSFVRNPWDRIVSEYRYRRGYLRCSFKDYLMHEFPEPGMSDASRHVLSQKEFIFDKEGNQLVDFVGRFENLQSDFEEVCLRAGLEPDILPRAKEASGTRLTIPEGLRQLLGLYKEPRHRHYSGYYDAESRELVATLYAQDIQAFAYNFQTA